MKLLAALLLVPATAHADLAIGAFAGVPGQGSGAPIGGHHIPGGLVVRYAFTATRAIAGGVGTPIAGVGASLWAGLELGATPSPHLRLYVTPGARAGKVGPGYFARHSDVFVGYEYNYAGPSTFAPRLAAGVAGSLGRAELFLEAYAEAPLLPSPELLAGGGLGVRVRL